MSSTETTLVVLSVVFIGAPSIFLIISRNHIIEAISSVLLLIGAYHVGYYVGVYFDLFRQLYIMITGGEDKALSEENLISFGVVGLILMVLVIIATLLIKYMTLFVISLFRKKSAYETE